MTNNNIPKHWQVKKLGEVCTYSKGKKPPVLTKEETEKSVIPYINIKAFEKDIIDEFTDGNKCNLCEDNDLLMVWDGARCGLIGKARKGAVGSTLMKILPKENIHKEYLYHFINSKFIILNTKPKGVGIPHIEPTLLWNFELVLPPLSEQLAIVSKIEELLSDLENGKQQLLTAQQQLKVYRQSLLKAAFEGRLTNKEVKDGELPERWKLVEIGKICKCIVPNRDKPKSFTGDIKWVTTPNLNFSSIKLDYTNITLGLSEIEVTEFNARVIPAESVIMTCVGTFGLSAVVERPIVINQQLHAFLPNDKINSKYLAYCIQNSKSYFEHKSTSTTIQYLNKTNCNSMPFPLTSLEEQHQIVQILESKLTVCDKIELTISQGLQQAETLQQSILKKAFEGRLVKAPSVKIVAKPKNEYFYQMQILALIAKASRQHSIEHGEMTLAKYAYLLDKVYGIPTYYDYNRWHLGPYPPEMKKAINNKLYFSRKANHIVVVNEDKLLKYINPYEINVIDAIDDLTSIFEKYPPKERADKTELLATVCKVIEDIKTIDITEVRKSMKDWKIELDNCPFKNKAEKFSFEETEKCLKFLIQREWTTKLIKEN